MGLPNMSGIFHTCLEVAAEYATVAGRGLHWFWVHMISWEVLERISVILGIIAAPMGFIINRRRKRRRKS